MTENKKTEENKTIKLRSLVGCIGTYTNIIVFHNKSSITMTSDEWFTSNHEWLDKSVVQMQVVTHKWNTISVIVDARE